MTNLVERVVFDNIEYAIIIRANHQADGIEFLTRGDYSQQIAYMHHPADKVIDAHVHNHEKRDVSLMQEVLIIKKGKLRVDFYFPDERKYLGSISLEKDDIILLAYGGHGFKVLEEVEMVEVKQGPYLGERDKSRFESVNDTQIKMI